MARPRNEELYRRITDEICNQMLERGYHATSYATIADACNTTRAVVQDYFPQKSQMGMLVARRLSVLSMEATAAWCEAKKITDPTLATVDHLYAGALTFFEFIQATPGRRQFQRDFLKDRDNTEILMFGIMEESFAAIGRQDVVEDPAYRNDLLMSIGGFYELFYHHLKHDIHFEATLYYSQMTRIWLRATGYPKTKLDTAVESFAVPEDTLASFVAKMESRLAKLT